MLGSTEKGKSMRGTVHVVGRGLDVPVLKVPLLTTVSPADSCTRRCSRAWPAVGPLNRVASAEKDYAAAAVVVGAERCRPAADIGARRAD